MEKRAFFLPSPQFRRSFFCYELFEAAPQPIRAQHDLSRRGLAPLAKTVFIMPVLAQTGLGEVPNQFSIFLNNGCICNIIGDLARTWHNYGLELKDIPPTSVEAVKTGYVP